MRIVGMVTKQEVKEIVKTVLEDAGVVKTPANDEVDYSKLDRNEIKQLLNEKGIEYSQNTQTKHLIKLLEGAE